MPKKKKKPVMTMRDALKPEDFEMTDELRDMVDKLGMKTVSLQELLENDAEIPYVTLDNISAVMDQLKTEEERGDDTVVLEHKSADGKKSQWRSKVFITGHESDMNEYFDGIADRLISQLGCDVYYFERDIKFYQESRYELLLSQMNYIVLFVSKELFGEGVRAYEQDLKIAEEYDIPVLPILVDIEAIDLYNENVGTYELLDVNSKSFGSRLTAFFSGQKVNGELVEQVKKAFPKRVFLSYRKKDYHLANVLLDVIREDEYFADVSIWYDSYLVPGEDYNDEIKEAILSADVVMLLVTPNVLEEGNYVQSIEYPLAKNAENIPVVPVCISEIDVEALNEKFEGLGEIYGLDTVVGALKNSLPEGEELSGEQEYLIGLSYLYGIVSERDSYFATEFLFKSAQKGNANAVEELWGLVNESSYVRENIDDLISISEELIKSYDEGFNDDTITEAKTVVEIAVALQAQYFYYQRTADAVRIAEFILKYADYISIRKVERFTALARTYFRLSASIMYQDTEKATGYVEKSIKLLEEINGEESTDFPTELYVNVHSMAMQIYRLGGNAEKAFKEGELLDEFTKTINAESEEGEKLGFINYVSTYLQLANGRDVERFKALVDRVEVVVESLELNAQTSTIVTNLYSVVGLVYHEVLKDIDSAIKYLLLAHEATKHADFELHGAIGYYATCKSALDLASCYSNAGNNEKAQSYFEEALTVCRENDFAQKYKIYKETVNRYANLLVMELEEPYEAMRLYDEMLHYISDNEVKEDSVIFDIPNYNFRIGYLLGNYFDNEEGKVAYMTRAKHFIARVVHAYGEDTPDALLDLYDQIESQLGEE